MSIFAKRQLSHGATLAQKLDRYSMATSCGCIVWLGSQDGKGYGQITHGKRRTQAHRAAWERVNGVISDGLELDHLCRVRACVNPAHLEPVTPAVNVRRSGSPAAVKARNAATKCCPLGHVYDGDNIGITVSSRGYSLRYCRECKRIKSRDRRAKENIDG